jgi:ribonuclease D
MNGFPEGSEDVVEQGGVQEVARVLEGVAELSVDVEADSMHAFQARLCFVQVGTDSQVFLLDTLAPGLALSPLAQAFADPAKTKFFHAAGGDLQFLAEAGVRVKGLFDTHRAATLLGWPKVGLADLVRDKVGLELAKEHQQADFAQRPLPPELRHYIGEDVRYLTEIGRQVRQACAEADILEETLLDCERLADEATVRPDLTRFNPKLPRAGLSEAQLSLAFALARALHLKRLEWAEAANVPMGKMLSNAAVTAIAIQPPKTPRELVKREGVRGAFVREHGDEVLALIGHLEKQAERGELPPEEARPKPDPKRKKREEALKAFRSEKAAERKVTPSVVLPNAIVDALSREPPKDTDALAQVPYFGEKRVRLYGQELLALLAG